MTPIQYIKAGLAIGVLIAAIWLMAYVNGLRNEVTELQTANNQLENQASQLAVEIQTQNKAMDQLKEMERLQAAKLKAAIANANTGIRDTRQQIGLVMKPDNKPTGCENAIRWLVEEASK